LGLVREELESVGVELLNVGGLDITELGLEHGADESVNQVLVLLVHQVGEDLGQAGGREFNLLDHRGDLTDNHSSVDVCLNLAKTLLENFNCCFVQDEMTEAPIVRVKEDGVRSGLSVHRSDFSNFLLLKGHVLNLLNKLSLLVIETNVEALRAMDILSVLARSLLDSEISDLTIDNLVFVGDSVAAFGLDPVFRPAVEIMLLLSARLIDGVLDRANEVWQGSVTPLVALEVNLQTISESLPANQENQLFDH